MDSRKHLAWTLALACMAAGAQTTVDMHPPHPALPGSTQASHFHFEARPTPEWARDFGQGIARAVAQTHKMTDGQVIDYAAPERDCKYARDRSCP